MLLPSLSLDILLISKKNSFFQLQVEERLSGQRQVPADLLCFRVQWNYNSVVTVVTRKMEKDITSTSYSWMLGNFHPLSSSGVTRMVACMLSWQLYIYNISKELSKWETIILRIYYNNVFLMSCSYKSMLIQPEIKNKTQSRIHNVSRGHWKWTWWDKSMGHVTWIHLQ